MNTFVPTRPIPKCRNSSGQNCDTDFPCKYISLYYLILSISFKNTFFFFFFQILNNLRLFARNFNESFKLIPTTKSRSFSEFFDQSILHRKIFSYAIKSIITNSINRSQNGYKITITNLIIRYTPEYQSILRFLKKLASGALEESL